MKHIAVLGEGAWGTAIASVLAHNGYIVKLWCHDPAVAVTINQQHCNERYMPGKELAPAIVAVASLEIALSGAEWVFIAIPLAFFRSVVVSARPWYTAQQQWVVLSKGVENETLFFPIHILQQELGPQVLATVVAGPSFAAEVIDWQLTGLAVASTQQWLAQHTADLLTNQYIRPFLTDDVIGVQCGGAFKNVMAVLIGIAQGAGFSDNTKALLLTRGWRDAIELSCALGARESTLTGLAGIGDLFLTLTGQYSKNLAVGRKLGQGVVLQTIIDEMGYVPEGANTLKSVHQLMHRLNMPLILFEHLYEVVYQQASADLLVQAIVPSVKF